MKTEIVSGVNCVLEILKAKKRKVFEIYVAKGKKDITLQRIEELSRASGLSVKLLDRDGIFNLSRVEKNQGVAAKVSSFEYSSLEDILQKSTKNERGSTLLMLDGITDPQNLGALIRTAHLTGMDGIILPANNSAPIGPAAQRASAGATEYIDIVQVTNLNRAIEMLKKENFWVVGADSEGENLYSYDFGSRNHLLVLGSEGKGLRRLVRENCDHILSIPMRGCIGSFNVSVAGAIFMSEITRQKLAKKV
ncbi:MAG: 23S rRNA (guanosine(2251)-2'-O)-methyltransferase RlmB [Pseudomonadota bacterium]